MVKVKTPPFSAFQEIYARDPLGLKCVKLLKRFARFGILRLWNNMNTKEWFSMVENVKHVEAVINPNVKGAQSLSLSSTTSTLLGYGALISTACLVFALEKLTWMHNFNAQAIKHIIRVIIVGLKGLRWSFTFSVTLDTLRIAYKSMSLVIVVKNMKPAIYWALQSCKKWYSKKFWAQVMHLKNHK